MAFGTANIVVRENAAKYISCKDQEELNNIVTFWKNFYSELFLEYFYVNRISEPYFDLKIQKHNWEKFNLPSSTLYTREEVLIPLGGNVSKHSFSTNRNNLLNKKVARTALLRCIYLSKKECHHVLCMSLMVLLNLTIAGD